MNQHELAAILDKATRITPLEIAGWAFESIAMMALILMASLPFLLV